MELNEKYMLTVKEASEYYNIGTKALRRVAENGKRNLQLPLVTNY